MASWKVRFLYSSGRITSSGYRLPLQFYQRSYHHHNSILRPCSIQSRQLKTIEGADKQVQPVVVSAKTLADSPTEDFFQVSNSQKLKNADGIPIRHTRPNFQPLDTTFSNPEEAYKSKTTAELIRALFVFRLTSFKWLVQYNANVSYNTVIISF